MRSLLLLALLVPLAAQARLPRSWDYDHDENHKLNVAFGGLIEGQPLFGGSAVVSIPLPPGGFAACCNDAFFLEAEVTGGSGIVLNPFVGFQGGASYRLYLLRWLAPYAVVRAGANVFFFPNVRPQARFAAFFGLGAVFRFHPNFGLRVEGGWPGARVLFNIEF